MGAFSKTQIQKGLGRSTCSECINQDGTDQDANQVGLQGKTIRVPGIFIEHFSRGAGKEPPLVSDTNKRQASPSLALPGRPSKAPHLEVEQPKRAKPFNAFI